MSSIKLSYVVYVGQDPNKKPLVVYTHQDTQARQLAGKPTRDDDVIMHLCALGDPLGRGGRVGRLPRPYLMSGYLTLWGKLHHL